MSVSFQTIEEGPNRIRISARFTARTPSELYRDWTEPDRLRAWWGTAEVLDLKVGGAYVFRWEKFGVLRGKYTHIDPGRRLEFSWAWDDDPEHQQQVSLLFRRDGVSGTELELTHGPYPPDSASQDLRRHHLEGWREHLSDIDRFSVAGV